MALPAVGYFRKRVLLLCQVGLLLLLWLYVVDLHAKNDGLWYQGDAPRHAANGLFWKDFIARFPVNPFDFAVSYFLRYPVITPTVYPPGFYLLEAAAFSFLGPSPFVAKGLVLAFTLAAGLYLMAWLHRWVSEEAGWGGALLLLQPGVIEWSHAIMLNIPSMALGLAALYHARRWMESPGPRHLYAAAGFATIGILTYVHTAIVLLVILAWIISERRWVLIWNRRVCRLVLVGAAIVLPWAFIGAKWAPVHASLVLPTVQQVLSSTSWTFYLKPLPRFFSVLLLALATAGIVGGIGDARWRREVKYTVTWMAVGYVALSLIMAKDLRYALLLAPPAVVLGVIGLCCLSQWASRLVGGTSSWFLKSGMAGVLAFHVWMAPHILVPVVEGMQEVVAFLEDKGRDERLFYDGHYNGMFSFYVRARDHDFRRGVVRGDKLLYPSAIDPGWYLTERVSSPADVVTVLQKECGCRWLALERRIDLGTEQIRAPQYLRKAAAGPEFKLVRSFPLHVVMRSDGTPDDTQIDVYEFLAFIRVPVEYEFRMPILGKKTIIRGKPID